MAKSDWVEVDFTSHLNLAKLKETILFICKRGHDDPKLGAIKLNKLLYYADFKAYRELGKPITGATYQNLLEGPAPKELLAARDELIEEKAVDYKDVPYFTRTQKRMVSCREPRTTAFTAREVEILVDVIDSLWEYNASEITELSHSEWGWKLTRTGQEIPYRTAWLSPDALTQEDIRNGIVLWKELSARPGRTVRSSAGAKGIPAS